MPLSVGASVTGNGMVGGLTVWTLIGASEATVFQQDPQEGKELGVLIKIVGTGPIGLEPGTPLNSFGNSVE